MPNPFGRPLDSKNTRGHKAGGARKGSGRKTNEERKRIQNYAAEKRRRLDDALKTRKDSTTSAINNQIEMKRQQRLRDIAANSLAVLKRISLNADNDEASNDNIDNHSDEEIDIEEDDNYDKDDDVETRKRQSYIPPDDSTLGVELDSFKGKKKIE